VELLLTQPEPAGADGEVSGNPPVVEDPDVGAAALESDPLRVVVAVRDRGGVITVAL